MAVEGVIDQIKKTYVKQIRNSAEAKKAALYTPEAISDRLVKFRGDMPALQQALRKAQDDLKTKSGLTGEALKKMSDLLGKISANVQNRFTAQLERAGDLITGFKAKTPATAYDAQTTARKIGGLKYLTEAIRARFVAQVVVPAMDRMD
jgi:hypothetical protein